jgi:hypothetical protein
VCDGPAVIDSEEVEPVVVEQFADVRVTPEDGIDRIEGRLDEHREPNRHMHPVVAVVQRLQRQADPTALCNVLSPAP